METCLACFVGTFNFETSSQLKNKPPPPTTKTPKTQILWTSRREKKPHIHTYKNIPRTIKSNKAKKPDRTFPPKRGKKISMHTHTE